MQYASKFQLIETTTFFFEKPTPKLGEGRNYSLIISAK